MWNAILSLEYCSSWPYTSAVVEWAVEDI